jgi:hypothetical protein
VWTVGCLAFLLHVASAFHIHYGWSHAVALRETARQAAELTGLALGGAGLYANYLFAALWVFDAAWWWGDAAGHHRRAAWFDVVLHSFMLFILFNGTVVFAHGPARWLGLAVTLAGAAALIVARTTERA